MIAAGSSHHTDIRYSKGSAKRPGNGPDCQGRLALFSIRPGVPGWRREQHGLGASCFLRRDACRRRISRSCQGGSQRSHRRDSPIRRHARGSDAPSVGHHPMGLLSQEQQRKGTRRTTRRINSPLLLMRWPSTEIANAGRCIASAPLAAARSPHLSTGVVTWLGHLPTRRPSRPAVLPLFKAEIRPFHMAKLAFGGRRGEARHQGGGRKARPLRHQRTTSESSQ